MYKKECKYCGKFIEVEIQQLFAIHVRNCLLNPKLEENRKRTGEKISFLRSAKVISKECPKCKIIFEVKDTKKSKIFCSHKCSNSHFISEEQRNKTSLALKNSPQSPLQLEGHRKYLQKSLKDKKDLYILNPSKCRVCNKTFTYEEKLRKLCSGKCTKVFRRSLGGYRVKAGTGKQGRKDGIWFNSTWEVAYYTWVKDLGLSICRSKKIFYYLDPNFKVKKFHPDFEVSGKIIEVKGPGDPMGLYKQEATRGLVTFLRKENLKNVFKFIFEKYHISPDKLEELYDKDLHGPR